MSNKVDLTTGKMIPKIYVDKTYDYNRLCGFVSCPDPVDCICSNCIIEHCRHQYEMTGHPVYTAIELETLMETTYKKKPNEKEGKETT